MLRVLHGQTSRDESAPVSTLRHEFVISQYIYHEDFERLGRRHGTEARFLWCITRTEPWYTWYNDMEGLRVWRGGCGERVDDLAGFEEGAWPSLDEEQRDGRGGGRRMVSKVENLWTVVWNVDFHFVLFEVLVDLCLWGGKDGQG